MLHRNTKAISRVERNTRDSTRGWNKTLRRGEKQHLLEQNENSMHRLNRNVVARSEPPGWPQRANRKRSAATKARAATVVHMFMWPVGRKRKTVERVRGVRQKCSDGESRCRQSQPAKFCAGQYCSGTTCSKFCGMGPVGRDNRKEKEGESLTAKKQNNREGLRVAQHIKGAHAEHATQIKIEK